jgi:tetratricopeptide (TPR) repeat protein/DNA-binding CsgD family transcriptional regulator
MHRLFLPLVFILIACLAWASYREFTQPSPAFERYKEMYNSLYNEAYDQAATQPEQAILYARFAADLAEFAQDSVQQGEAHHLAAYFAEKQGFYGMAIRQYQRAYLAHPQTLQKAVMLKNMAYCYQNAGNPLKAKPIVAKAVENFSRLDDQENLSQALQLAGNNYRRLENYQAAHAHFRRAIALHKDTVPKHQRRLASLYSDFARLKEQVTQPDSAIYYQRLALELPHAKPSPNLLCMRVTRLAWYYLRAQQLAPARQTIERALQIKPTTLLYQVMLEATRSLLLFVERRPRQGRQVMERCDSLLAELRTPAPNLAQQKFVHKLAYEINRSGKRVLSRLAFYGDSARYVPHRDWFAQRYGYEKALYDKVMFNIALKDSLVIAKAPPQTQLNIIQRIGLGWWLALVGALALGGGGVYYLRSRAQRAHVQSIEAQISFIEAIKRSPIKGYEDLKPAEMDMLQRVQVGLKRALKPDEIKMLVMVARGYTYKQVSVNTGVKEDTIKSRMRRIKKACGDDFLQG